ncbi:MAG TPA: cupin domain-containing protein [Blastocatellia bacterium]|nr:cupin domain-containing protein [Blastocatellia bacterium]
MNIVHSDSVFRVPSGTTPDYNRGNSLVQLLGLMEKTELAAEREYYLPHSLQYLFPFKFLELYGPAGSDADNLDPQKQDNKTDFQKQNVKSFLTTDIQMTRGLVSIGDWTGPFLRASYRGGPDSKLSAAAKHQLGDRIKLWLKVNDIVSTQTIAVPYNEQTDRYEIELWGYPKPDLMNVLDAKGRAAFERGEIMARPDLIQGSMADFERAGLNEKNMFEIAPNNAMHPILPLHLQVAWSDFDERTWDSQNGENYNFEFNMRVRGWDNFIGVGISPNPHGGVGFLEYRNLMSNYGRYAGSNDLSRTLRPWNFNAYGRKDLDVRRENFMAVDYMDLHILKPNCGIGLHRHRDNQEVFLMMEGHGLMVVGDWCKLPERERCFEIRTLLPGHLAMLKGGQLHGLMNVKDEDASLFMFGGYD